MRCHLEFRTRLNRQVLNSCQGSLLLHRSVDQQTNTVYIVLYASIYCYWCANRHVWMHHMLVKVKTYSCAHLISFGLLLKNLENALVYYRKEFLQPQLTVQYSPTRKMNHQSKKCSLQYNKRTTKSCAHGSQSCMEVPSLSSGLLLHNLDNILVFLQHPLAKQGTM